MTPDLSEHPSSSEEKDKSVTCPSCRKKLPVIARYCPICGNELWKE